MKTPVRSPARALHQRAGTTAVLFLAAFGCLAAAGAWLSDYALEIGFRLFLVIALAEAWNLLAGYGGLVSLATASFIGIGGYVLTGLVNAAGLPLAAAIPAAGLVASLLAVLLSPAVFRLRGLYFTVGTLAFAEAFRMFMVNYSGFGGATGLFLQSDPPGQREMYWIASGLLAFTTVAMTAATSSRFSILLRTVRDDEDAAAQIGVRPFRIKLIAFATASFLMGMAGALQGLKVGTVEPYGMFGIQWTVNVLSIVVIGGQGLRAGPVVGGIFLVLLGEILADYPALHMAITGLILILIIRFAPQGLVGLVSHRRPTRGTA